MPTWDKEQARAAAAKSVATRQRLAAERKFKREHPEPLPPLATPAKPVDNEYTGRMKGRARKVIDRIATRMTEAIDAEVLDAQQVDRLASGWSKLAEVERQYDDRPLPGTKKPESRPSRAAPEPEVEPVPIVASAPQ